LQRILGDERVAEPPRSGQEWADARDGAATAGLICRAQEFGQLVQACRDAAAGRAGVVVIRAVEELAELCARYDFGYYREWALVLKGWAPGGPDGLQLARRGVQHLQLEGALTRMPYWLTMVAELQAANGDPAAARSTLDAAIAGARLRGAAAQAAGHGSIALLRRCEQDLALLGVQGRPTGRSAGAGHRTPNANASRTLGLLPSQHQMDC
jgi:hypothetical protein